MEAKELGHLYTVGGGPHLNMLPLSAKSRKHHDHWDAAAEAADTQQGLKEPWERHSLHVLGEHKQNLPSTEKVEVMRTSTSSWNLKTFHHFYLPSFPLSLPWLGVIISLSVAYTIFLFNNYNFLEVTNSLQLRKRIKTGKACDGVSMEYCPALEKQQLSSRISGLRSPQWIWFLSWIYLVLSPT